MKGLKGISPLIWERLRASWHLVLVLAFGIIVAATLLAASPVYTRVMNNLGLASSLKEQIGSDTRNTLISFDPLGTSASLAQRERLEGLASDDIGWLTGSEVRYANIVTLTLGQAGQPLPTGQFRPTVTLSTFSGYESHVRVVEGRLPQATSDPNQIEVALPSEAARVLGAKVGDRFYAGQAIDDCNRPPPTDDPDEARERARFPCVPQTFTTLSAPFTIVGFVAPIDAGETYWSAGRISWDPPAPSDTAGASYIVLLPEGSFFTALPLLLPGIRSEYHLASFADVSCLDSANLQRARDSLARLKERAQAANAVADLALASPLGSFNTRASFNQVTLLLLLLQVVGIAIYYVLLVASLLAERRAEEVAMLRSRGATVGQIVTLAAVEAAVLALVAAVIAPFLASALVAALGHTSTFSDISGHHFLPFVLVPQSFLLGLAGAGVAAIAVIVPSFFAARRGVVLFLRGTSRPGRPFMQRYYVDVVCVALAALGLWELNQRGSVFDPHSVGGWSADPLLLASPFLLILAVGALLFRFLPLLLRLVARIVTVTGGPGLALGMWQLTRSPARYTQLALLVVMAAAVGTFAATYGATTDRSQTERARFEAGVDLRTNGLGALAHDTSVQVKQQLDAIPGVQSSAAAYRGSLSLGPQAVFGNDVPVLGVDPEAASSLLWFRKDFAGKDLDSLMTAIRGSPAGGSGIVLQGEPVAISLFASTTSERPSTTLWLRTLDADGVFHLTEMGILDFTGYRELTATFAPGDGIKYPLSIVGLLLTQPASGNDPARGSLFLDDITAIAADGERQVVEDFEGPFRWDVIRTATRNRDLVTKVTQGTYRGDGAAQFAFRIGTSAGLRGLYVSDPNLPMPAIASQRFLDATGAKVGSEVELVLGSVVVPLTIRAAIDLFPSMDDTSPGFLIVNQEHLYYYAGLTNQPNPTGPNESWLSLTTDPTARATAITTLQDKFGILSTQLIDVQKALAVTRSDPVVRAGGSGVLLIAVVAAFTILALGFALTLYLGGQARTLEVSVLRAVGLSPAQVFAMISFEYLLVAGIGLIVGTVAGLRISATMLTFLNVTAEGARVVPPFSLVTNWDTVGLAFVATAIAFLTGVLALGYYFLHLPVNRFLRLTR